MINTLIHSQGGADQCLISPDVCLRVSDVDTIERVDSWRSVENDASKSFKFQAYLQLIVIWRHESSRNLVAWCLHDYLSNTEHRAAFRSVEWPPLSVIVWILFQLFEIFFIMSDTAPDSAADLSSWSLRSQVWVKGVAQILIIGTSKLKM